MATIAPKQRWRDQNIATHIWYYGDGATFQTEVETARPIFYSSRLRWIRCNFPDQCGDGRLFRPMRRRRDFSDRGGNGATKIMFLAIEVDTVRLSRPGWRRRAFSDQGGDGATYQTEVETARPRLYSSRLRWIRCSFPDQCGDGRLFRPMRRRRDFSDRGGNGATKFMFLAIEVDTVRISRPGWRLREFSDQGGTGDFSDQCEDGATFQTEVETAQPRLCSSQLRWIRCDFPDQGGDGAPFQTKAETARLTRRR